MTRNSNLSREHYPRQPDLRTKAKLANTCNLREIVHIYNLGSTLNNQYLHSTQVYNRVSQIHQTRLISSAKDKSQASSAYNARFFNIHAQLLHPGDGLGLQELVVATDASEAAKSTALVAAVRQDRLVVDG